MTTIDQAVLIQRNKRKARGPNTILVSDEQKAVEHSLLSNLPVNDKFTISFGDSSKVHKKALIGDAVTVQFTPTEPYLFYETFTRDVADIYMKIGQNTLDKLGSISYTLAYEMKLKNRKKPDQDTFDFKFILLPCINGRIVTPASQDFKQVMINQKQFDMDFALMANRHGSDVVLVSINRLELQMIKVSPRVAKGKTWFKIPDLNSFEILNVHNDDNMCFKYAILSSIYYPYLKEKKKSVTNITSYNQTPSGCTVKIDLSTVEFDEHGADYESGPLEFERANPHLPYAVHVWKYNKEEKLFYTVRVSPRLGEQGITDIDLYLAEEDTEENPKSHYVWIKDLKKLLQTNKHGSKLPCRKCLAVFNTQEELQHHYNAGCLVVRLPTNLKYWSGDMKSVMDRHFMKLKNTCCVIVNGVEKISDEGIHSLSVLNYQIQCYGFHPKNMKISGSYVCSLHYSREQCLCVMNDFMEDILLLLDEWKRWVNYLSSDENPYCYPLLTTEEEDSYRKSNDCHLCLKTIKNGYKNRDHCHITGKYRGPTHHKPCNINYNYSKHRIPIIMPDSTYMHHIIRSLDNMNCEMEFNNASLNADNINKVTHKELCFMDGSGYFPQDMGIIELNQKWIDFRDFCMKQYNLDPVNYDALTGMAYDAALLFTGAQPDKMTREVHEFIEKSKRGAINIIPQRYHVANNVQLAGYDNSKPISYLANFDIKSAYGYSMKQPLPYNGYMLVDSNGVENNTPSWTSRMVAEIPDDAEIGYFFEVDLKIPQNIHWHNRFNQLPLAPTHRNINGKKMLICDLNDKNNYVVHYRLLKYYLRKGCSITKFHTILKFNQKPWLKPFMELQEKLREEATEEMKDTIKLITNSIFGMTCINSSFRTIKTIYRLNNDESMKSFAKFGVRKTTVGVSKITDNLIVSSNLQNHVWVTSPMPVGCAILELGKLQLYTWFYDKLRHGTSFCDNLDNVNLLYADTDSLICSMSSDPKIVQHYNTAWFDGSVGSLKNENGDGYGVLFIGVKPKHYLYQTTEDAKVAVSGLPKESAKTLNIKTFTDALDHNIIPSMEIQQINTKDHIVQDTKLTKKYMDPYDDTRHYIDTYTSRAIGHILNE